MVVDSSAGATWLGDELYLLRGERLVKGTNVKIIFPEIKDLGVDKNKKLELAKPAAPAPSPAIKVPAVPNP